jgi:hypothetical protein
LHVRLHDSEFHLSTRLYSAEEILEHSLKERGARSSVTAQFGEIVHIRRLVVQHHQPVLLRTCCVFVYEKRGDAGAVLSKVVRTFSGVATEGNSTFTVENMNSSESSSRASGR